MTNAGLLPGLNQDGWKTYPLQVALVGGTNTVQPALQYSTVTNFARYLIVDHSFVVVEIMVTFFANGQQGIIDTTPGAYVFKLPFPARRMTGPGTACPIPLGCGPSMAYWSFSDPWVTAPIMPTLSDPFTDLAGQEDNYVQCYTPFQLSWGSAALAASTVTVLPTQRNNYPINAEDIDITFTDASGVGAGSGVPHIINITSGSPPTFDLSCFGSAAAASFNWRLRGKQPTGQFGALLSPLNPWDNTPGGAYGSFPNMFMQLSYEPKR